MSSKSSASATSDLTSRARIREAAIGLFGSDGFAATSVRGVAAAAGVSAGLVIHHFGGKDALRASCDDHVLAFVKDKSSAEPSHHADVVAGIGKYGRYLARMVSDGSAAGNELFDRLLTETRQIIETGIRAGTVRQVGDTAAVALVVTIQSLAPLILAGQLARHLGDKPGTGEWLPTSALLAVAAPTAEIYARGLFITDAPFASEADRAGA